MLDVGVFVFVFAPEIVYYSIEFGCSREKPRQCSNVEEQPESEENHRGIDERML